MSPSLDPLHAPRPLPASGVFAEDGTHYFPARVYFEDTDLSGVVYHANYLRFMERARSDMLRVAGIDQRASQESGTGVYAVADVSIQFRRPARLDDDLIVESDVTSVGAATCSIQQRVMRGPELLAQADITVAFLSPEGRPRRQPKEWIAIFNALRDSPNAKQSVGEEKPA